MSMRGSAPLAEDDRRFLAAMNRMSREHGFDPEVDLDWSAETSDQEFLALYDAWSLLAGSGKDAGLDARSRIDFARYQQANLMLFTAALEQYGLRALETLHDNEDDPEMVEALGHFVQEEKLHQAMFLRAVARLEAAMPERRTLPRRHVRLFLRAAFALLALAPFRRLRVSASFLVMEFAEEISLAAHAVSSRTVARKESFAPRIWALHAIDEARHLRFDAFIRRRYRPAWLLRPVVKAVVAPLAAFSSLLLNANDVWAARQVGARVSLWHLPWLVKKTTAPFKRSVFSTITKLVVRPI